MRANGTTTNYFLVGGGWSETFSVGRYESEEKKPTAAGVQREDALYCEIENGRLFEALKFSAPKLTLKMRGPREIYGG